MENKEETGQVSCQLSDAVQQGTDPRSNPGPDVKEKSESNSELEEKQKEETTEIPSSSQTESHPHSKTQPKRQVDRGNGSKAEGRKGGPSGDYLPDNASTEKNARSGLQKEETGQVSCQLSDAMQQGTDPRSNPGPDAKEENESNSELEEKQKEETTEISSSSQTESHPHSDTQPKRQVDRGNGSKAQGRKGGPSGDYLPDNASTEENEMKQTSSSSQTKGHPHSDTQVDRGNVSKAEGRKEESPLNIQKPEEEETTGDINEEDVEIDESEDQDQDKNSNLQPQITVPGNNKAFWICAAGVILLGVVCALMRSPDSTPPVPDEFNVVDVFNQEMKKLETSFPNQHPELWRRSLIHLRRHLKTKNPTEPVSLILTSGHRAEKTLGCLAQCLAQAFSIALNSSVLNINGKDKASQDSDQVKLDIDSELRKAFEGKKSAAVIHRFEELPPGSTLIFYRYCDHENAAYKDVFLAFTVMLDAEVEVPFNVSLGRVEEMVQEHIKQKFVSSDKSAMFNQMDVDKLSGLWSRISHLILPVAAEGKIEQQGCGKCNKSF